MRLFLTSLVWLIIVGGLALYMGARETAVAPQAVVERAAPTMACRLEILPGFDARPDPFALRDDEAAPPAALLVRLGRTEVLRVTDDIENGRPLQVDHLPGLAVGDNEFYLEAFPPIEAAGRQVAVRLRFFCNNRLIADRTFWSAEGGAVSGSFPVHIGARDE